MRNIKTIIGAALSFGLLTACTGNGSGTQALEYLPVQFEEGDSWSIIDKDGKVVVKEEYSPDDKISHVSPEGAYWVKSGEKLQLYNIKNPKRAVSDTEYDAATEFAAGRSVVSVQGQPLQVIDTGGKVIATLPKDMTGVFCFEPCGLARFCKVELGKMGCIDRSGKVLFEDDYSFISEFGGGQAYALKNDNSSYYIYDSKGNLVGQFPRGYELLTVKNGGGLFAARKVDAGEDEPMVFLDTNGKRVFSVKHSDGSRWENRYSVFSDGYSVFTNKDGKKGIVNDKGEEVVRAKYNWASNFGDGLFYVSKDGKSNGIINVDDEIIVDFEYEDCLTSRLGENFIMKQDGYWYLIGSDGKEVSQNGFFAFRQNPCSYCVTYVDIEALAKLFVKEIGSIDPNITPEELAKTKLEKQDPDYHDQNRTYLEYTANLSQDLKAEYSCRFEEVLAMEKTHQETTNDGWFTSTHTVYDGLGWNNSPLGGFYMKVNMADKNVNCKQVCEAIRSQLKSAGYADENEGWLSKQVKGKNMRIKVEEDSSDETNINVFGQIG